MPPPSKKHGHKVVSAGDSSSWALATAWAHEALSLAVGSCWLFLGVKWLMWWSMFYRASNSLSNPFNMFLKWKHETQSLRQIAHCMCGDGTNFNTFEWGTEMLALLISDFKVAEYTLAPDSFWGKALILLSWNGGFLDAFDHILVQY